MRKLTRVRLRIRKVNLHLESHTWVRSTNEEEKTWLHRILLQNVAEVNLEFFFKKHHVAAQLNLLQSLVSHKFSVFLQVIDGTGSKEMLSAWLCLGISSSLREDTEAAGLGVPFLWLCAKSHECGMEEEAVNC